MVVMHKEVAGKDSHLIPQTPYGPISEAFGEGNLQ